jgi:hypothetical protein
MNHPQKREAMIFEEAMNRLQYLKQDAKTLTIDEKKLQLGMVMRDLERIKTYGLYHALMKASLNVALDDTDMVVLYEIHFVDDCEEGEWEDDEDANRP